MKKSNINKDNNIVKNETKKKNDSTNISSISINMNVMIEKLIKNQEDIEELISQKEYLLNLIINSVILFTKIFRFFFII